ncbi:tumor necrosis factor receptor superfamily member 5-like isoform X2 [Stegostoma tigrinum]|uniref:tumor necrosis factor receptor superfamily member 5-like isoform X2 n=1 Tax=Stegostoma tigrinum TaxID=3053191 RepID=UPI00202AE2ED|nr:tumor necrosis factor receptor superfamily member 5-like isoform X2 [Stegostoma tigrinum]
MLKHNKAHDLSREPCESGSSSYSPAVAPKQINCQEMVHVPINAEKLNVPAANPLVTILSGIISEWTLSCFEECEKSYSGYGRAFRMILFVVLLTFHPHLVISCDVSEYGHAGHCCTMCSPGTIVFKHCTEILGTICKACTAGEYIEHPNGLDKCFKCKTCDPEMGLQIKQPCSYTRNTECKPRNGHYCKDKNCQMAFIHKTCPPGEGVKEKGTQFKDTVCEVCADGTYSSNDSSTEPCVKWTKCEERNQKLVNQGTSKSDAVCKDESNPIVIPLVVAFVIIVVLVGIAIFYCKMKKNASALVPQSCCLSCSAHRSPHLDSDKEAAGTQRNENSVPLVEQTCTPMPESTRNNCSFKQCGNQNI